MTSDAISLAVTQFLSNHVGDLRLVAIGQRMQHILSSEELMFRNMLEADFAWSNQDQLAIESKDDPYLIVIADMSNPLDHEIAESIAREFSSRANSAFSLMINTGEPSKNMHTAFSNRISMCNGFKADLLDALLDGPIRLYFDPGWVGVDLHDINATLDSNDKNAYAAVAYASGEMSGKAAAQAAIDELKRGGINIADASGAFAMMAFDGVGLSQAKAAMTLIRDAMHSDATIAYSCHAVTGNPFSVRIALIASPNPLHSV